jgi:hypothetical protein
MRQVDIAYCAGFFDGEGHVEYNGRYSLQVSIAQNERTPLDFVEALFGGYVRLHPNKYNGIHNWHGNTNVGATFLETVLPFLIVKKADAEWALSKWEARLRSS